ncbi:hypothetical protein PR002_g15261 [Phytophthora rubi]|uniref:HAT C-terminal dimerisation domain-containing protein n=2 Tax=Phytophthora rubi TaxID=129364 RepID=A0A6A3KVE7_9STRA|nr:hypothetical protein PR002_g15261 [Phytophthora rubi]
MGCAVKDCQEGDDLKRDPCSVCGNLVHHICAIGVFEVSDSALNERFCSLSCVSLIYPNAPVPSSENPPPLQSFENRDSSVVEPVTKRRRTGAVSKQRKGAFPGKTIRIAASTAESNPPYDGLIQIAPPSPPASPLSDLGVPASLKHFRKEGTTDDVWDLVHTLEKPYRKRNPWKPSRQLYCNLCILCCQDVQARTRTNRYSWEEALRNTKNASNAKDHIKSKHADHPLAKLAEQKTTQKAKNDVVRAEADAQAVLDLTVDHEIDSAATRIFAEMTKQGRIPLSQQSLSESSLLSQESSPSSSPASTGWDDEDELLLGAPIRTSKTRDEVKESEINARADRAMQEWFELEPEWLEIAQRQSPEKTREELSKDMTIDKADGMHWALLGLYKHIDVLKWFRDEGEIQFPSIALLARIHLGKISSSAFQERVFSTGSL